MNRKLYNVVCVTVMAFALLACVSPEVKPKPPPLIDTSAFSPASRPASLAVAEFLTNKGESAKEFFADVEVSDGGTVLVFHLWHQSAFEPQNRATPGNPGGKNRDIFYDVATGKITRVLYWQ